MGQTLQVPRGAANAWVGVLRNGGVPLAYAGSEALDAELWRGGEESPLFAPAVAWLAPASGSFTLSVSAAQTAPLDPGVYRLQVGVTVAGARAVGFDGGLEILEAPGTDAAPMAWCSSADVLLYSHIIRAMQGGKGSSSAGFLEERATATARRSRMIVERYCPRNGFVRVRQNRMHPVIDAMDIPSPVAVPPSKADLTAALAVSGGIVLEEKLREIVARDTVALVLRLQSNSGVGRDYLAEAVEEQAMADDMFRRYRAQVITPTLVGVGVSVVTDTTTGATSSAGFDHFLIGRDCTILPTGTAP